MRIRAALPAHSLNKRQKRNLLTGFLRAVGCDSVLWRRPASSAIPQTCFALNPFLKLAGLVYLLICLRNVLKQLMSAVKQSLGVPGASQSRQTSGPASRARR